MKKPSGHLDICRRNFPGKGNSNVQRFEAKKKSGGGLGSLRNHVGGQVAGAGWARRGVALDKIKQWVITLFVGHCEAAFYSYITEKTLICETDLKVHAKLNIMRVNRCDIYFSIIQMLTMCKVKQNESKVQAFSDKSLLGTNETQKFSPRCLPTNKTVGNKVKLNYSKGLSKEPQWCQVCKYEKIVLVNLSFRILQNDLIDRILPHWNWGFATDIWWPGTYVWNERDMTEFKSYKSERKRKKETLYQEGMYLLVFKFTRWAILWAYRKKN